MSETSTLQGDDGSLTGIGDTRMREGATGAVRREAEAAAAPDLRDRLIEIDYTNHRGERRWRKVIPIRILHRASEWHPGPQWLLVAHDAEKGERRDFALSGVHAWRRPVDAPDASDDPTPPAPDLERLAMKHDHLTPDRLALLGEQGGAGATVALPTSDLRALVEAARERARLRDILRSAPDLCDCGRKCRRCRWVSQIVKEARNAR